MIDALVLHDHTKQQVAQFIAGPAHAVLLVGSNGIGKTHLAETIVEAILQPGIALNQYPYFSTVRAEKGSISIDTIRELQRFLQLKTLGSADKAYRRAVIIEHAEQLTAEAQNAYLKLLEEPPADTIMVLTADNQRALLPTILSRLQAIAVYAPNESNLKEYFASSGKDEATINQAYFLSGGLPGLMHALLEGDQSHPLLDGVAQAKEILQKQVFERLVMVEGLSKQKESVRFVIEALRHIAQTGLDQSAKKGDAAKLRRWHHVLSVAASADAALRQNANAKLVLSDLMLRI